MASKPFVRSSKIPRIILISAFSITIMILLSSLKMSMPFFLSPLSPIIQLNSLLVSNFKVSGSNLAAIWLANLTMYNPNVALSIQMDRIEASVLYKHDNALSLTSVNGFELGSRERRDVYLKFVTAGNEGDQPIVEYPLLRELEKDRKRGNVGFRIRFNAMARYEIDWPGWKRRAVIINPCSVDLDVNVGDGRRKGRDQSNAISDILGKVPMDGSLLFMIGD